MRVTLVNPPYGNVYEKYKHSDYQFPLGLGYIAGSILKSKHKVDILDCNLEEDRSISSLAKKICDRNPEVVGMTCTTPLWTTVCRLADEIKFMDSKIKIAVGGPHITALWEHVSMNPRFDAIFVNESEDSFRFCLDIFCNDSKARVFNMRNPIKDSQLDQLPIPPRELFYEEMVDTRLGGTFTYMITSRGCVGKCKYCVAGNQKRVAFRSVASISEEIERILGLSIRRIAFEDDNFLVRKTRVAELAKEFRKYDIEYFAMAIAKFVDEDVVKMLADSGCTWLCYGVESGNENILREMGRLSTIDETKKAIEITKKAGIKIRGSFMLGWLYEAEYQMRETLKLIKDLNCDENAVSIVTPYPGTQIWDEYFGDLKNIDEIDFDKFCYYNKIGYNLSNVSDRKLLELQQEAFQI